MICLFIANLHLMCVCVFMCSNKASDLVFKRCFYSFDNTCVNPTFCKMNCKMMRRQLSQIKYTSLFQCYVSIYINLELIKQCVVK